MNYRWNRKENFRFQLAALAAPPLAAPFYLHLRGLAAELRGLGLPVIWALIILYTNWRFLIYNVCSCCRSCCVTAWVVHQGSVVVQYSTVSGMVQFDANVWDVHHWWARWEIAWSGSCLFSADSRYSEPFFVCLYWICIAACYACVHGLLVTVRVFRFAGLFCCNL